MNENLYVEYRGRLNFYQIKLDLQTNIKGQKISKCNQD